jgi:LysM repeat protein
VRDARGATGSGPAVCPFVALLEDRDRRADGPDPRNRCYASPAPRQRELAYQAEYCYSDRFSTCAAFLDWAARNAAEPSYPVPGIEAARVAETRTAAPKPASTGPGPVLAASPDTPSRPSDTHAAPPSAAGEVLRTGDATESIDWVPAAAWAAFPAAAIEEDEEPEEMAAVEGEEDAEHVESDVVDRDEPTIAPRVPAALPMRRRRRQLEPIRSRGSGEWFYSDPPDREPLVRRRFSAIPPVVLGAIGLIVAALVVLLIPSLLAGGDPESPGIAGGASPSPGASTRATPRPTARSTADASAAPATPEPSPRRRSYRVRSGDSLSRIAVRLGVSMELIQCQNLIRNPDLITVGQVLTIPPEGYACAPGWRRATPTPEPLPSPEATEPA